MTKVMSATEAAHLVRDGDTVLVDGSGGGVNEPGLVLLALADRFLRESHPTRLTIVHPSGIGDGQGGGIDYLAHPGLVSRVIGGHWNWCSRMQALATSEQIEAYCLPQGVISHLFRAIAGGKPGVFTHVGLGTFVDPRIDGGRLNAKAKDQLVETIEIRGREYLFYPSFKVDVAIIRGTTADAFGNITMEGEGLYAETLAAAQAARNSGGRVIAQVKTLVKAGELDPRIVKVPGTVVDAVVVNPDQRLSFLTQQDPSLTGALRVSSTDIPALPLNERKIIARRAAFELHSGDVANLGYGMPDGVATVLAEEGLSDHVTFTLEQGHYGGVPATGADFGMARNQMAMIDAGAQFDFYDGGGLDVAVLSFAQVDPKGNVNVSKFGGRIAGIGGFVNIAQGAKRVVFVGTLRAGKQTVSITGDGISVQHEAKSPKFVSAVEQISFGGAYALQREVPVTYVTERAVFELAEDGLVLTEVAAGLDLERDVLQQMEFRPRIAAALKTMDARLFATMPMGLQLAPRPAGTERY
ncbi:3-oxoacid CoA-transferase [Rhodovastum sp. RN2-1]|uniref:Acetate CoA-transferase YdiF n=1 Tax=Limobrevibacterium gyesilva TaxID=2991712 RepID=A0AA41YHA6_9PROT|nr:3-oxoacid CoA-transferase [Limobrevibacterium gyesilva]